MEITIKKAENGWVIKDYTMWDKEEDGQRIMVVEENDMQSNAHNIRDFLYAVMEMTGMHTSKHDKEQLHIIVYKPDECPDMPDWLEDAIYGN